MKGCLAAIAHGRFWHIAAPDVCDGTSAVGESRHRIPGASVGQPTDPAIRVWWRPAVLCGHDRHPRPALSVLALWLCQWFGRQPHDEFPTLHVRPLGRRVAL